MSTGDEFTLVTKEHPLCAKRSRYSTFHHQHKTPLLHQSKREQNGQNFEPNAGTAANKETLENIWSKLELARQFLNEDSKFLNAVLDAVSRFSTESVSCDALICYGLGHFSSTKTSLFQLALLLKLGERLKPGRMLVYDPIFTQAERLWLKNANFQVLKKNDACMRSAENCSRGFTVFYMPHCGWPMYNNVLYANWSARKLEKTVILGNSFLTLLDLHTERAENELKFIVKSASILQEGKLRKFERCENAFSDLSVQWFCVSGLKKEFWKHNEGPPVYGEFYADTILQDWNDLERQTGGKYTHKPLRIHKLGGRDPETGIKFNQHIGGGVKFDYFMVDLIRRGPKTQGSFYEERVLEVRRDPNRTPFIALVAGTKGKRWIIASENMQAGQIIKTTQFIPTNPISGEEGNAYPVGSLAVGTNIHCIEKLPGMGAGLIVNAGAVGTISRRHEGMTVVQMPNKREFSLKPECMCIVGRVSNPGWKDLTWGSGEMHRRFGYRPKSGLWHRKTGYDGRKNRPIGPVIVPDEKDLPQPLENYKGITHKLDKQFVKHEVSESSMEWNPNVELSSACGCALSPSTTCT